MNIKKLILLLITHTTTLTAGFVLGIYMLPILAAPASPSDAQIKTLSSQANYQSIFTRELAGSDFLHWGEGMVSVGNKHITLLGALAPGPEYKLYLSPHFVETETEFNATKSTMLQVGSINTFENFIIKLDDKVDITKYNTVIVWCEAFGEFITASQYRE